MPLSRAYIIGYGYTKPSIKTGLTVSQLLTKALQCALDSCGVRREQLDAMIGFPALADPRFMPAHAAAQSFGLLPRNPNQPRFLAKTIDCGGASPVSALIEARRLVADQGFHCVAVAGADAVSSLPTPEFLRRADEGFIGEESPAIPRCYDRIAQWHIAEGRVTRSQLAAACALLSQQAARHPDALTRTSISLEQVMAAPAVAPVTSLYEVCAVTAAGHSRSIIAISFPLSRSVPGGPTEELLSSSPQLISQLRRGCLGRPSPGSLVGARVVDPWFPRRIFQRPASR
jgi:acetyl-CoA acetyltransferase